MEITRMEYILYRYMSCALFLCFAKDEAIGLAIDQSMGNPMLIRECNHLVVTEEGQVNSFLGDHGEKCCMCAIGKRVKRQCNTFDPNSTLCEDCADGTYINHGPNSLHECHIQETCPSHMIQIGGSTKSRARCECQPGYIRFRKTTFFCIPDKLNKITTDPKFAQGTPETNVADGASSHSTDEITNPTTAAFEQIPPPSSDSIRNGLIVIFLIIIFAAGITLWYTAERKGWIPEKYHWMQCHEQDTTMTDVPVVATSANKESRVDEEINRTDEIHGRCFENIANSDDEAVPTDPLMKRQHVKIKNTRNLTKKKISDLEKQLRKRVFEHFAREITFNDLECLAHKLLEPRKNAYEDIFDNSPRARREQKANLTFTRAVEINPNLTLKDIKEAVGEGLGYLTDKIDEMLQKSDVAVD